MRLRYNNKAGSLGSPALTSGATTINFASNPGFSTLVSPDYIPIILDPPQGPSPNASFEIVYLTAYTSGATTGTIARGQEGTSATAHNVGAIWAVAPTFLDLQGQPPIGSCVPYTGSVDPPETNWVIADGRLINRTTFADFFNRSGHAYNGGIDPGGGNVKIPDLRQKLPLGKAVSGTGSTLGGTGGGIDHQHTTPGLTVPSLSASVTVPDHGHGLSNAHAPFWIGQFGAFVVFQALDVGVSYAGAAQMSSPINGGVTSGVTTNGSLPIYGNTDGSGAFGASGATGTGSIAGSVTGTGNMPFQSLNYVVRIA